MPNSPELTLFIQHIMSISVLRMGGAFAGIVGSSNTDNVVLDSLKKNALDFGREYSKPVPGHNQLVELSKEIYGCLRTLQVTYTLSEKEAERLTDELQALMDKFERDKKILE
jgi:hypothetical protein